ncbi:MAG: sigma-70 family RNA polymerase sigma factor [Actinobacteria bacterium]|nr:sigma-70 family RNA polymerase sigma factor [Actinomycetota bacterium]
MDERSDGELLTALRGGDTSAFAALWTRHSGAARRLAKRIHPSRAEDLVSESFLAIYTQVTTTDAGPTFAFRPYLKAVMRNTAMRWSKDDENTIDAPDAEQIDHRDALSIAEADGDAAEVLAALQELPERWQRVLWLAEVVEVPRPAIARELGIKPNAVSALQRRARLGLKLEWLTRQIPISLRDDAQHAARLFPRYLTEPRDADVAASVTLHIATCSECAILLHSLRGAAGRIQRTTLAVLLGSAGIGAASATLSSATTAAAVVAAGAGALTWLLVGGAAVTVGSLVLTTPLLAAPSTIAVAETAAPASASTPSPLVSAPSPAPTGTGHSAQPTDPGAPPTGRLITDPTIPDAGLSIDSASDLPLAPTRPVAARPDVPGPAARPDPAPSTDTGSSTAPTPGMTSPAHTTGYISPVLTGTATPGAAVAIQLGDARYAPVVAADGTWSFDTRGLQLGDGTYSYQIWAFTSATPPVATQPATPSPTVTPSTSPSPATSSPAVTGSFTVLPLVVHGFENITGTEDMLVPEAQTTGLVVSFQGPPNGTVFVQSIEGHTARITLGADGTARRRLLMNSRGWYYFTMRYLDGDGFWGPGWEHALDVYDPAVVFDPWGPNPDEMTFELVAP